jgi:hypothetical protein
VPQNIDYADELHTGQHRFEKAPQVPDGSWGDAQIGATNPITCPKLKHQHNPQYGQANGSAWRHRDGRFYVARSAGQVVGCEAGVVTPAVGAATVTVDLKKNGTSVLTSVVTITNAQAAYARVAGAIATAAYVAGDVFTVVVTATAGGGTLPQGLFADGAFQEGAG